MIDASVPPHPFIRLKIKKNQEFEGDDEPDRILEVLNFVRRNFPFESNKIRSRPSREEKGQGLK